MHIFFGIEDGGVELVPDRDPDKIIVGFDTPSLDRWVEFQGHRLPATENRLFSIVPPPKALATEMDGNLVWDFNVFYVSDDDLSDPYIRTMEQLHTTIQLVRIDDDLEHDAFYVRVLFNEEGPSLRIPVDLAYGQAHFDQFNPPLLYLVQ